MVQGRILIIDDCDSDIELLLLAFRDEGVTNGIDIAQSARAAIAHLAETAALPGLIILDSRLPDAHGFAVLRLLRDDVRSKHLPIVILSGVEREGERDRARELRADAFLIKPAQYRQLRAIVRTLKNQWLTPLDASGAAGYSSFLSS